MANILGYTQEQWDNLNRREKRRANWKYIKQNIVPGLLGGSLGVSLFASDPKLRKIGTAITAIGISAGAAGIDPTNLSGAWEILKKKGANLLDLKKGLTNDQKVGLSILGEQDSVKSSLSFLGDGKAKITTESGEDYGIDYGSSASELTGVVLAAKGVPKATANKVVDLVAKQPIQKKIKIAPFLQKLWTGVWDNLPQIIESMKGSGLDVPETFDPNDGWQADPRVLDKDEKDPKETPEDPKILGIPQNTFIGGLGLAALGYAVLNK